MPDPLQLVESMSSTSMFMGLVSPESRPGGPITRSASGHHTGSDPLEFAAWLTLPPTHVWSNLANSDWISNEAARCRWFILTSRLRSAKAK